MKKGTKHSQEAKNKIAKAHLGIKRAPFSGNWRLKRSLYMKGRKIRQGKTASDETRKAISLARTGKKMTQATKEKISKSKKGIPCLNKRGSSHHNWKGGITPEMVKIRGSIEMKLWRSSVFARDKFTCRWCGKRGVSLQADHIQKFSTHPELRFAIDNGRTLCVPCHKLRHKVDQ